MKDKVIELLVKWGYSDDTVSQMVEDHFDYAVKTYPDSKPSFIADVVCTL